jgi:hypothetical protein
LEAVAAFEAAEEQTEDEDERVEEHLPRGDAKRQSDRPNGKHPDPGNGAGHGQPEGVPRADRGHGAQEAEGHSAARERCTPAGDGHRPPGERQQASLARKAGERSVAVQSARVSTATAKAVTSETMLRVLPNGWVNVETPTTASATDAAAQFSFCSTSPVSLTGTALHLV